MSAGWLRATVLEETHELDVLRRKRKTWVPLRVEHPGAGNGCGWVDRCGQRAAAPFIDMRAHPRLLRRAQAQGQGQGQGQDQGQDRTGADTSAPPQVVDPPLSSAADGSAASGSSTAALQATSPAAAAASFFVVRWGGAFLVAHAGGGGAWGASGCTISDTTIAAFFDDAVAPQ